MASFRAEKIRSRHVLPTVAAAIVGVLGCATRDRGPSATTAPTVATPAAAAPTAGKPVATETPDAGSPRAADAGADGLQRGIAGPEAGGKPIAPISSPCVLHAGQGKRQTRTIRGPGAPAAPEVSHGSCSANAECIASKGHETVGDGFVRLDCTDRACTCSLELLAAARPRTRTSTFELSSPCTTSGQALQLIVERCMPGLVVVRH